MNKSGGATPRTIAAATILLRPRIQTKIQDGSDTPKARESAAWLEAHEDIAAQTLGKKRRSSVGRQHHSPRIGNYTEQALSWDAVAATVTK